MLRKFLQLVIGGAALAWMLWGFGVSAPDLQASESPPTEDPLAAFGLHETQGAAAGYVEDRACRLCHTDLYDGYQEVGMAQSFFRPSAERAIEDFDQGFFHAPSGQTFEMKLRDGRYLFRRYLKDRDGQPVHVFERPVDWVLGSGHRSRTYLMAVDGGELYQLPLAWYSQTQSWGMAPGFDSPQHEGLQRRVRRECMFCHNAYPEVAAGSDAYWQAQTYPQELPQGTGCQRCHGPGAEHIRQGQAAAVDFEKLRQTIVNPARLPPGRRDDVCNSCHLQPSVALSGLRRFDRGDYSFRPGEALSDYMVQVDVEVEHQPREERFEINHHPYRLRQSPCFEKSGGALTCTTCHDPHRKVPPAERATHYRQACLSCHEVDACDLQRMGEQARESLPETLRAVDAGDCVACHMQERRPSDVVRVTMTDHFIRRHPAGAELLAAQEERAPVILDATPLAASLAGGTAGDSPLAGQPQEGQPQGALWDVYRAMAVLRAGSLKAVDALERYLVQAKPPEVEPYLELARGRLHQQDWRGARRALDQVHARHPNHLQAVEWLAQVAAAGDARPTAIRLLQQVVERDPRRPEAYFNLGLLQYGEGQDEAALASLDRALELRFVLPPGLYYRGRVLRRLNRLEEAEASLRRCLEIDPTFSRAYVSLADLMVALGRRQEARSLLEQAVGWGAKEAIISRTLGILESLPPAQEGAPPEEP